MIYSIKGQLSLLLDDSVIIDVNGIGYEVIIPTLIRQNLPPQGAAVTFYTYHSIREDSQQLFGFLDLESRQLFIQTLCVNGLGPKVALKLFSNLTSGQIISAIASQNIPTLTSVPGIGKKMAEKMILELKDKLNHLALGSNSTNSPHHITLLDPQLKSDLHVALKTLGYSVGEINNALEQCKDHLQKDTTLETGVKVLLKHL